MLPRYSVGMCICILFPDRQQGAAAGVRVCIHLRVYIFRRGCTLAMASNCTAHSFPCSLPQAGAWCEM